MTVKEQCLEIIKEEIEAIENPRNPSSPMKPIKIMLLIGIWERINKEVKEEPMVVKGDWIPFQRHMFTSPDNDMWYCSKCHYETNWRSSRCPNCGLTMEGI